MNAEICEYTVRFMFERGSMFVYVNAPHAKAAERAGREDLLTYLDGGATLEHLKEVRVYKGGRGKI